MDMSYLKVSDNNEKINVIREISEVYIPFMMVQECYHRNWSICLDVIIFEAYTKTSVRL